MTLEELQKKLIEATEERFILEGEPRSYAVMILIADSKEGIRLVFEKRSVMVSQPGEICFPGGRVEEGETPEESALRECEEELGIPKESIQVLGKLGVLINAHRSWIHCYIGKVPWMEAYEKSFYKDEVETIYQISLDHLLEIDEEKYRVQLKAETFETDQEGERIELFPTKRLNLPMAYEESWPIGYREIYVYHLKEMTIWGITGRLLKEFLDIWR